MKLYRPFSPKFPYPPMHFLGRDKDVMKIMKLLDFSNQTFEIVCIVGSPGIGKSSLAITVGNEMIVNNVVVHYVNMADFPEGQLNEVLSDKINSNIQFTDSANVTFDKMLKWAGNRFWYNLILLDNCDNCINIQKEEYLAAIEDILTFSSNIKFLTTSREEIQFSEKTYYTFRLDPLSTASACELLDHWSPVLNDTEKKLIAKLTGEVPLALRVIGSLFSVKVRPTPTEIIEKLTKNPIPTLSSDKMARKMRLNHSISLSYNYLDSRLQKIGRYLAHFPGSFDTQAAVNILSYISNNSDASSEYLHNSVSDLVTRSLLEYNQESGRFHFHRLIKEFFIHYSKPHEKQRFHLAFQLYFGEMLCIKSDEFFFADSPKDSLITLDVERHNFQFLMNTIQNPVNESHHNYEIAISCFVSAIQHKYLPCRFPPEELLKPIRSALSTLRTTLVSTHDPNSNRGTHKFSFYGFVQMTILLASLTKALKGTDQAVQEYMKRVDIVEKFGDIPSTDDQDYIDFYKNFLRYESQLSEASIRLYHSRILKHMASSHSCEEYCDYYDIGITYWFMHDYKNCIIFFEKAMEIGYFTLKKVQILLFMRHIHKYRIPEASRAENVEEKLVNMFSEVMDQSSSSVISHIIIYGDYFEFLTAISERNKSAQLQEKLIDALLEIDPKMYPEMNLELKIYELAKQLFHEKEFSRAAKLMSYAVSSTKLNQEQYISYHLLLSKSIYYLSNSTEANRLFVGNLRYILENNLTLVHESDFVECCSYLIFLNNFDYVSTCYPYFNKQFKNTWMILQMFMGGILTIHLNCPSKSDATTTEREFPTELYPTLVQLSKSQSVSFDEKSLSPHLQDNLPSSSTEYYFTGVLRNYLYTTAMSNSYLRFFLNFLLVFLKLLFLYYSIKCCCCCLPCCCYRCIADIVLSFIASLHILALIIQAGSYIASVD